MGESSPLRWRSRRTSAGNDSAFAISTQSPSALRGLAIGRVGDVINGEHYGPPSNFLLAVRNTHPDADTPDPAVAFHSGGLSGVLLGAAIFALLWPLRHRFARPTMLLRAIIVLYAAGRFVEAFFRLDSGELALGLSGPQWISVALLLVASLGALWARRRYKRDEGWSSTWGRPMLRAPSTEGVGLTQGETNTR